MSQQEGEDSSSEEEEKQEEIETPVEKQEKEVKEEANIEKSVPEVTPSQDMEEELEQFDQLMSEVKNVAENANDLTDAERRRRAEEMIFKLMNTLNIEDN